MRREEFFTELLPTIKAYSSKKKTYYPCNKIFQHHALPPAAAATATISSSSVITSNINSNKIYVIDSKGSANKVSAAVLTYDYDTECFQTLSNPRKTHVSPKEC